MNGVQIHTVDQLIANGLGSTFSKLRLNGGDTGILKPYVGDDGYSYVNQDVVVNQLTGQTETRAVRLRLNAATVPLYAWQSWDDVVVRTLRSRLGAMADVRSRGLEKFVQNAMGKTVLVSQTSTDIGPATVSMDPTRRSEGGRPELGTVNFPLVIVHKDFDITERELQVSQSPGVNGVVYDFDTEAVESATFAVAEMIDRMLVGIPAETFKYAGGYIYGYTTLPERALKTDMPIPDGTNGTTVVNSLLTLRQLLIDTKHYGPYMMYVNTQWAETLDNQFKANSDRTLREVIMAIDGIQGIRTLDYLPATKHEMLLVEMQARTVRAVVGFEPQTVRWESNGGMMHHYKVMGMVLGQVRPDTDGNAGIAHGKTSA